MRFERRKSERERERDWALFYGGSGGAFYLGTGEGGGGWGLGVYQREHLRAEEQQDVAEGEPDEQRREDDGLVLAPSRRLVPRRVRVQRQHIAAFFPLEIMADEHPPP